MRTPLYLEHCPLIISSSEEHWATWDEICNMFYHWPVQNLIFFIISNIGWDNIFLSSTSSEYNIFWVQNLIFLIIIVWATWDRHWHFHLHYHLYHLHHYLIITSHDSWSSQYQNCIAHNTFVDTAHLANYTKTMIKNTIWRQYILGKTFLKSWHILDKHMIQTFPTS